VYIYEVAKSLGFCFRQKNKTKQKDLATSCGVMEIVNHRPTLIIASPWRLIAQGLAVHDKISYTKGCCTLGDYRNRMATLQNRFKSD